MLGLIGINYKTAPLEIREKYSFSPDETIQFIRQLKIDPTVLGAIILSTCNRMEVYFHCTPGDINIAYDKIFRNIEFFKKTNSLDRQFFVTRDGIDVTDHLFRVVSGLESLVLGEDQVVAQVKYCFRLSLDNDLSSPVITRLFNKAFEAGKLVRSETAISKGSASISSASVELLCKKVPKLETQKILIIGAGIMSELALSNIIKRNCRSVMITNRTFEKAAELAKKYNIPAFEFNKLREKIGSFDIIFVATGAQEHIITPCLLNSYIAGHKSKQIFMDLSVPRNICPEIGQFSQVELYVVDHLKELVKDAQNKRKEAVSQAVEVINIVKQEFNDWLCSLELTPVILKIKKNLVGINALELDVFLKNNGLDGHNDLVARYGDHISHKYARLIIRNLKNISHNGKKKEYLELIDKLFELSDGNGQ